MRHLFFFLVISFFTLESANAQIDEWHSTISRNNPDKYYVVSKKGDSLTIYQNKVKNDYLESKFAFKIRKGEGRMKDESGTREKHKNYLLNKSNDTLLTIRRKSSKIEFADASFLIREETPDGWIFTDEDNQMVYEIELLWNKSKWSYSIKSYDSSKNIDALNQFVSLSLTDLARYKSAPDGNDTSDDVWFILWLAAI